MAGGAAVTLSIGDARRDAVGGFAQRTDRRGGHGNAPVAGGVSGGAVVLSVQRNGDRRTRRLIAGAGKRQIGSFSIALITSSPAMVLMLITGALRLTVTVRLASSLLPADR
ncbi:hypothetical protein ECZU03_36570 [Escherichia coli]|nr:hypothetical protein ECZU03_36570 [Escherichia coli]